MGRFSRKVKLKMREYSTFLVASAQQNRRFGCLSLHFRYTHSFTLSLSLFRSAYSPNSKFSCASIHIQMYLMCTRSIFKHASHLQDERTRNTQSADTEEISP